MTTRNVYFLRSMLTILLFAAFFLTLFSEGYWGLSVLSFFGALVVFPD